MKHVCASLALLALVAGCASQATVTTPTPAPVASGVNIRLVRPSTVNPKIDPLFDYDNVYIAPVGVPVNRLFLFLPGTWAPPIGYSDIVTLAALHGYHTISLDYPNLTEIDSAGACGDTTDPNCWGNFRNEVITGQNTSPLITVKPVDSVTQRLIDMINYAAKLYPTENWSQYLSNGQPVWANIYVGGHSQGAGDAAYLGYMHVMGQTCSIEGPDDGNTAIPVAAWLQQPQATGPDKKFGFFNKDDQFAPYARGQNIWDALGFAGPQTDVDSTTPPYGNSHQLYTVMARTLVLPSHDLTAIDTATPKEADGTPVFAPVWQYACFP